MDKNKLYVARRKIDQLDKSIFNLIKKRTKIVKYILSLKKFKNQIVSGLSAHESRNVATKSDFFEIL